MTNLVGFPQGNIHILDSNNNLVGWIGFSSATDMEWHSMEIGRIFGSVGSRLTRSIDHTFDRDGDWWETQGSSAWEIGGKPFHANEADMVGVPTEDWLRFMLAKLVEFYELDELHKVNLRCPGWWGTLWVHKGKVSLMGWYQDESGVHELDID
jgi:hypothetical protein